MKPKEEVHYKRQNLLYSLPLFTSLCYQGSNFWTTSSQEFSLIPSYFLTKVGIKSSSSPLYLPYLKPLTHEQYLVTLIWFFFAFLAFATIPLMIWYSSMYLFSHQGKTRKHSFKVLKDRYGRERLIIDYIKWREK